MELSLATHNVAYAVGIFFVLSLAVAIFFKGVNRKQAVLTTLMCLSILSFQVSHLVGVNIADPILSKQILMFNLGNIFTAIFLTHWVLVLVGRERKEKISLFLIYGIGILITVASLADSTNFLHPSVPKLYFPNYYEPGILYGVMVAFFLTVGAYTMFQLIRAYMTVTDDDKQNRVKYVIAGQLIGFAFGSLAFLLVYDIPVDPAWSAIFSIFPFFLVYAMARYKLLDIEVVAQRALLYGVGVAALTILISLVSVANTLLLDKLPQLSILLVPFLTSLIAVVVGGLVWRKIREADVLKYEFVNIVTHKFETPLTHIKWSLHNLMEKDTEMTPEKQRTQIKETLQSAETLIKLTHLLTGVSSTYVNTRSPEQQTFALTSLVTDALSDFKTKISSKELTVHTNIAEDIVVSADPKQVMTVFNVVLENALIYTPEGGTVVISAERKKGGVAVTFTDNGIGIDPKDKKLVTSSFFRADNAKKVDTEGMGLGLYLAKNIVNQQNGSLSVESEGEGRGTTVTIVLPRGG